VCVCLSVCVSLSVCVCECECVCVFNACLCMHVNAIVQVHTRPIACKCEQIPVIKKQVQRNGCAHLHAPISFVLISGWEQL